VLVVLVFRSAAGPAVVQPDGRVVTRFAGAARTWAKRAPPRPSSSERSLRRGAARAPAAPLGASVDPHEWSWWQFVLNELRVGTVIYLVGLALQALILLTSAQQRVLRRWETVVALGVHVPIALGAAMGVWFFDYRYSHGRPNPLHAPAILGESVALVATSFYMWLWSAPSG
jgi:hypothetical protein